jgi:LPXTG-site transpeptidase (sortase) family protein
MRNSGLVIVLLLFGFVLSVSTARYLAERIESSAESPPRTDAVALPAAARANLPGSLGSGPDREIESDETTLAQVPETDEELAPDGLDSAEFITSDRAREEVVHPRSIFGEVRRLVIPRLKVDAEIIYSPYDDLSWDVSTLGQRIAWLGGQDGGNLYNLALAGHVTLYNGSNGPFLYLFTMQPGELIIVYTADKEYTFKVRELLVVYPEESTVTQDTEAPQLTLITCHTWNQETLSYLRRQVVLADLESVKLRPSSPLMEMNIPGNQ